MRGKEQPTVQTAACTGITPAYAGKSSGLWNREWKTKDHPRLCGEKRGTGCLECNHEGSPPPMRGKAQVYIGAGVTERITPAYAGKSCSNTTTASRSWDHPRLCGEKFQTLFRKVYVPGSPPPMRGKEDQFFFVKDDLGITPAYAGKSLIISPTTCQRKDHPRLCGEKFLAAVPVLFL